MKRRIVLLSQLAARLRCLAISSAMENTVV